MCMCLMGADRQLELSVSNACPLIKLSGAPYSPLNMTSDKDVHVEHRILNVISLGRRWCLLGVYLLAAGGRHAALVGVTMWHYKSTVCLVRFAESRQN